MHTRNAFKKTEFAPVYQGLAFDFLAVSTS